MLIEERESEMLMRFRCVSITREAAVKAGDPATFTIILRPVGPAAHVEPLVNDQTGEAFNSTRYVYNENERVWGRKDPLIGCLVLRSILQASGEKFELGEDYSLDLGKMTMRAEGQTHTPKAADAQELLMHVGTPPRVERQSKERATE